MAKSEIPLTYPELVEQRLTASYPQLMFSLAQGSGTDAFDVSAIGLIQEGAPDQVENIGLASSLLCCLRFAGGFPVADFVDTAYVSDTGKVTPGIDLGSDHVLVIWQHFPGDGDPWASRNPL
jgi:hypothetical protein